MNSVARIVAITGLSLPLATPPPKQQTTLDTVLPGQVLRGIVTFPQSPLRIGDIAKSALHHVTATFALFSYAPVMYCLDELTTNCRCQILIAVVTNVTEL